MRGVCVAAVVALAAVTATACGGGDGSSAGPSQATTGGAGGSAGATTGGVSTTGGSGGSATSGGAAGSATAGSASGASGGSAGLAGAGGTAPTTQVPPYDVNTTAREGCSFGPGARTTETVGPDVPHGDALPFEHVVVLMMENRSFDHYFSKLPEYGVTDVDVAPADAFNYDPDMVPPTQVERYHESRMCILDVEHHWTPVHLQYNEGAMDGFVATNNPGGARAMGYYDSDDLPYYYWLAKNFAISDRHFCSLLGPTWPNRFYFYGATSWGNTFTGDVGFLLDDTYRTATKITDQLEDAGRSWKIYRDGIVSFGILFNPASSAYRGSPIEDFEEDVDNDALPNVAIIDPSFTGSGQNDEHPPVNPQRGEEFTARILGKLMANPTVWQKTVFILFYDEHGGFYDHVPPPPACEPDNLVPPDFRFDRFGVRTPLVIASPWTKPGYVSHRVTGITSVTRFIQNRFDLPAMTNRDANAWPMLDMFDFDSPQLQTPPSGAPSGQPDPVHEQWCENNEPGTGMP